MTLHDTIQMAFTSVADAGDTAKVVGPLEITPQWTEPEAPEIFPTGV